MTSKLTRLTDDELTETLRQATSGYPLPASVEGNLRHAFAELQERRKAAMDSEPVAYADPQSFDNFKSHGGKNAACTKEWMWRDPSDGLIPLYRHAQPAPETEREPIAWLNDAYLARGVVDGEAGSEDVGPGYIPVYRETSPAQPAPVVPDYFASLVAAARVRADKAIRKFPQPNYVLNKVAEESGEVIKAVIHYTEGREEWSNVEAEIIDNLDMLLRLVKEGDQVIGFTPPVSCRAAMLQDGTPTNEGTRQVDELTMWIKRLVRSLKNSNPDSKLSRDAMDYLTVKGLISVGDILR